jgi:hypothetical protein
VVTLDDVDQYNTYLSAQNSLSPSIVDNVPFFTMFWAVSDPCLSTYINFTPKDSVKNIVEFNTTSFNVTSGWRISPKPGSSSGFQNLISKVTLVGCSDITDTSNPIENEFSFQPGSSPAKTITYTSGSETYAPFNLRLHFSDCTHPATTQLRIKLTNGCRDFSSDDSNAVPIKDFILLLTNTINEFTVPFKLITKFVNTDGTITNFASANNFYLRLSVDCAMPAGASFTIDSITIFDEMGRNVCETNYLTGILNNLDHPLRKMLDCPRKPNPILHLADESIVGNFWPMHVVTDTINKYYPKIKFVTTWPIFSEIRGAGRKEYLKRFIEEVSGPGHMRPEYLLLDRYPITMANTNTNFPKFKSDIYADIYQRFMDVQQVLLKGHYTNTPMGVLQLHNLDEDTTHPTKSEIIAMSYATLLTGSRGLLYWWSGVAGPGATQCLYKNTAFPAGDTLGYYLNADNMWPGKDTALQIINQVLNYPLNPTINSAATIGDLLSDTTTTVTGSDIVGRGDDGTPDSTVLNLGEDIAKVKLQNLVVVDSITHQVLDCSTHGLIGVNSFSGGANTTMYLVTNLNPDGRVTRVRCSFNSTNTHNVLKISTVNTGELSGNLYPKNPFVEFTVPQDGVVLLKVENF